jgi:hypothetical protein
MQDYARTAIRLKYQTLYDGHAWRESMRVIDLVIDQSLNGTFFIPLDTEEVIFLKFSRDGTNYERLDYRERDWIERKGYVIGPYNTSIFYRAENLGWPYLNPGKLTIQTSEITPLQVHIEGVDANGYGVQDDFQMVATQSGSTIIPASVITANSYANVTMFSKGYGGLSVFSEHPVNTMTIQAPQQVTELVFSQFCIYPNPIIPDSNGNPQDCFAQIQVKLKADVLNNDMSVPRISHIWDCLIEYTLSSLYTRMRQLAKADMREQKAIGHFQAAINVEKAQSEYRQQAVPTIYDTGDYLRMGSGYITSYNPWGW